MVSTARIDYHYQRLADLGTRLRALADVDVATIRDELAAIEQMDPHDGSWEEFAEYAAETRRLFLTKGHARLREALKHEATPA